MLFENFKYLFHESWHRKIREFVESEECDEIYKFLKKKSGRGVKIAPLSFNTYRCFKETSYDDLKIVLASYCPYHSFYNGLPVADGLAFSCSITNKLQPSLISFYEGIANDLYEGEKINYSQNPSLLYLAKQGVLLWNVALTVEKDKAGSHNSLWEPFTKFILEEVLAYTGVPIIFIGKDAQKYEKYVSPITHGHIFKIEHPSFAARMQTTWDTQKTFTHVNKILRDINDFKINWL